MKLATLLGVGFFDLDQEVETFFGTSIERLQNRFPTTHSFRNEAAKALTHLIACPDSHDSVIALPPSGLMGGYLRVIKKSTGITVALHDKPEHILERITFYDLDSKPIERVLTRDEKREYLREIKKDITYFGKTYERAQLKVDILGVWTITGDEYRIRLGDFHSSTVIADSKRRSCCSPSPATRLCC